MQKVESVEDRRKFKRFFDRSFTNINIELLPCPPLYGDIPKGFLVDLSLGGMALILSDILPKRVFLKMTMTLPDGFMIESAVTVRYVAKKGRGAGFLHGIEFLNLSPESIEKLSLLQENPQIGPLKLELASAKQNDWDKFKDTFKNHLKEAA